MGRFVALALLLACLAVICACGRDAQAPAAAGASPRIVALSPAVAATLRDLGLADRLVGRHGFDAWSEQALPVCGDQSGLDYEALVHAAPTDVLLQLGRRPVPERLAALAEERGWRVRSFDPLALDDVRSMTVELLALYGGDAALPARLDAAWSRRPGIDHARCGRVALIDGDSGGGLAGLALLGPGSFHHDLLVRLGGTPALNEGSPFMILDAEDVLRLAPDAVIAFAPGADEAAARGALAARLQRLNLPRGRIAVITDPMCLLPGSNLARTADAMAAPLERWSSP